MVKILTGGYSPDVPPTVLLVVFRVKIARLLHSKNKNVVHDWKGCHTCAL
jgi:hypothetical protein